MDSTNTLTAEEIKLLMENKLIYAIKSVRERTGLGLREAKDLCDTFVATLRDNLSTFTFSRDEQCPTCYGKGTIEQRYHLEAARVY